MSGDSKSEGYTRRKLDQRHGGVLRRNLEWGRQPTDIELHPQSPVMISERLAEKGSLLRLTPSTLDQLADPDAINDLFETLPEKVTSIQTAKTKKAKTLNSGQSVNNLLTLHTPETLRERCKSITVQNALVKKKGEKRLYLAVGILNWQNESVSKTPLHSPLLFYPVQLISEESAESTSGFVHRIRTDSETPEFNYQLASEMMTSRGITVPVYNGNESLSEFFSRVERCLEGVNDARLEHRMTLGLANAPAGITTSAHLEAQALSKLPKHFDPALAKKLIADQELDELRTTLKLLNASNDFALAGKDASDDWPDTPDITEVRQYAQLLSQHGLGNVQFQNLPDLPEQLEEWIEQVQPVLNSDLIEVTLQQRDIKAVHLMKVAGIIELLDKAPDALQTHVHKDLAYRGTPLLFKRAKYQARLIEDELKQLKEHFYLDRVPPKPQLLQLLDELAGGEHNAIEIVDSDYFHARRRFMELSIEKPATLNDEHKRQLNQLVKVLRFRELFVNNTEYRLALGSAYRGLRTDWDELETLINYAQELSSVLLNESIAAQALGDWKNFRQSYIEHLDQLQQTGTALRMLMQVVRPSDHNTSATELLIKAGWLADQLNSWNMDYGLMTNFGDKTPDQVLKLFSGKSSLDEATETRVRYANNKLQSHLMDHKNDKAILQINATLTWLHDAVTSDAVSLPNIESIIEKAGKPASTPEDQPEKSD